MTNTHTASMTRLPFSRPCISEEAIAAVGEVLRSGWITSGPKVIQFEKEFAAYCGAKHAVAVSSATAGIDLALAALHLQPGEEVIVPSINWVSGANLVELNGGTSVLCDVLRSSMQIDPASVAERITPRTRAIMPVHFAGAPCDLPALRKLAPPSSGIAILEDAAHATGTRIRGVPVGRESELAVFSFHPSKNMTTAEGGMVLTDQEERADWLRLARFHGIRKDAWKHHGRSGKDVYQVLFPSRKYNLTDIQAVLGIHQLREVDRFNAERHRLAMGYHERLRELEILEPLALPEHSEDRHSWHIFVVALALERLKGGRAAAVDLLEQQGIGTAIHYPAVHTQEYYAAKYPGLDLPVSAWASERLLSIPLFPGMTDGDLDRVAEALLRVERELGK
jgi:UDP-4-amino-4-deoxy-L-arabinose-oxoglutarate aminotransferase